MAWELLREIVEELDVSEYVDLYTTQPEKYPRFAEAWEGLKWLLGRTPALENSVSYVGDDGEETNIRAYCLAADELAGTPEIWVVYLFTDTQVVILGVQAVEVATEDPSVA